MATSPSIRVVKAFVYRGVVRNYSNRYHFTGGTPADSAHWTTFSDAIVTAEKAIFPSQANGGCTIVETLGYAGGSDIPVFTKTYATAGTLPLTGGAQVTGDTAALIRYSTADRSHKNHPVYCFNYYHGVLCNGVSVPGDLLLTAERSAMGTYASNWLTGFSDGSSNYIRSRPNGDVCTGQLVALYLTHRDLPR